MLVSADAAWEGQQIYSDRLFYFCAISRTAAALWEPVFFVDQPIEQRIVI
jgi:hypothetical protein